MFAAIVKGCRDEPWEVACTSEACIPLHSSGMVIPALSLESLHLASPFLLTVLSARDFFLVLLSALLGDRIKRTMRDPCAHPWTWAEERRVGCTTSPLLLAALLRALIEMLSQICFPTERLLFCHTKLENSCCERKKDKSSVCLKIPA